MDEHEVEQRLKRIESSQERTAEEIAALRQCLGQEDESIETPARPRPDHPKRPPRDRLLWGLVFAASCAGGLGATLLTRDPKWLLLLVVGPACALMVRLHT